MPIRLRISGAFFITSKPHISALPEVSGIRVESIFMVVDFPAPFTPRKPRSSPFSTVKDMPFTALKSPYCFVSLSARMMFISSVLPVSCSDIMIPEWTLQIKAFAASCILFGVRCRNMSSLLVITAFKFNVFKFHFNIRHIRVQIFY